MVTTVGIFACAVAFVCIVTADKRMYPARPEGKCCNDSFCEGDCGGWGI